MRRKAEWLCVACTLAIALVAAPPLQAGAKPDALTLWYERPAADWEREGLPIGNGAMGAMLLGGVAEDNIQFNEKTLWTGGPGSAQGYDFGLPAGSLVRKLRAVQDRINHSKRIEPEDVAVILGHKAKGYGDYQSFGSVVLKIAGVSPSPAYYRRELDIDHAIGRLRYMDRGVHYLREYFADYPDRVVVIRLSADKPRKISFSAAMAVPDNRSVVGSSSHGRISVSGALNDNGLKYEAQLQVLTMGGHRADLKDGTVRVSGADSAVLILAARTNYAMHYPDYRGADPHATVQRDLDLAGAKSYDRLLADHEQDYRALFGRVVLNIGQTMPDIPTDRLLAGYQGGEHASDRALEALYFQYGRYLLISSSRAGSLPANLQGVWNRSATPPWNADYHVNINLQMNYWLADPANLPETTAPLFDFVDGLVEPGRASAAQIFGARGWLMNLNTNPWGYAGLIDWPTAFWQPEAAAWLCQHYYDHYRFTQDETFLRERAYPAMKAVAAFWLDALVPDPRDGKLVVSPSYSPEHGPFSAGGSMSQEIVFDLFTNVSEAAKRLGDDTFGREIDEALAKLDPGLRIGSWGQLQEWKEDWDDPKDDHRHVSHLFALHPGRQISPFATPAFAAGGTGVVDGARRWRDGMEQSLENQFLGAASGRRPCAQDAQRAAPAEHAAQSLGHPSAVSDRRQFRRDGGRGRDADSEPERRDPHPAGVAACVALRIGSRTARARRRDHRHLLVERIGR